MWMQYVKRDGGKKVFASNCLAYRGEIKYVEAFLGWINSPGKQHTTFPLMT